MLSTLTFNWWFIWSPCLAGAAIAGGWYSVYRNKNGKICHKLKKRIFDILSIAAAAVAGAIIGYLMIKESFDGFVEACGRDHADSAISAMMLIVLLASMYSLLVLILIDAGRTAHINYIHHGTLTAKKPARQVAEDSAEQNREDEIFYTIEKHDLISAMHNICRSDGSLPDGAIFRVRATMHVTRHISDSSKNRKKA